MIEMRLSSFMCLLLHSLIPFHIVHLCPLELFVSCFVDSDSHVDSGCKKLNNLVIHATVLFQSASNSDIQVSHEKSKNA